MSTYDPIKNPACMVDRLSLVTIDDFISGIPLLLQSSLRSKAALAFFCFSKSVRGGCLVLIALSGLIQVRGAHISSPGAK